MCCNHVNATHINATHVITGSAEQFALMDKNNDNIMDFEETVVAFAKDDKSKAVRTCCLCVTIKSDCLRVRYGMVWYGMVWYGMVW